GSSRTMCHPIPIRTTSLVHTRLVICSSSPISCRAVVCRSLRHSNGLGAEDQMGHLTPCRYQRQMHLPSQIPGTLLRDGDSSRKEDSRAHSVRERSSKEELMSRVCPVLTRVSIHS